MFGRNKQAPIRTLIGEGTVIRGEICFTEGLRIDGEVFGDVSAGGDKPSMLVISERARVTGKVKGGHVIVNGQVVGPVMSSELLELQPRARVTGDIHYGVLEMHQGAIVDGELRPLKVDEKPALTLATSNRG